MATTPLVFNFDTTCLTTSTIASTPIVCATPTPSFSPKRKYQSHDSYNSNNSSYNDILSSQSSPSKRQRISVRSDKDLVSPTTPLYRNFGNGISLCNNTKINKFSNIEEILHFLTEDDDEDVLTTNSSTVSGYTTSSTISGDIAKELMIELSCKNELPELNNVLLDLKDVLRSDIDFILR